MSHPTSILALNGGSSSIKFAVYEVNGHVNRKLWGKIDRIGSGKSKLTFQTASGRHNTICLSVSDHGSAVSYVLDWLEDQKEFGTLVAIGHRIVQGLEHSETQLITQELMSVLNRMSQLEPDHLPVEIHLVETCQKRFPDVPQVACFDSAFHQTMPMVAKLLPIPRRFEAKGVRRYGYHGLSYAYLMQELKRLGESKGRVILAHLGSGASMSAVLYEKALDTTMGFTPASGLVMGTRPGDLDPGLAAFLMESEKMTPSRFNAMINHESGLLGISETSSDMQELLARETNDIRAYEAVSVFCYQAKKWIGAYTAVLGGLDTLVFAGGIGEKSAEIRTRICEGLDYLGLKLDEEQNRTSSDVISSRQSLVKVRVIQTDEELMIAKSVRELLAAETAQLDSPSRINTF
jgi:acetate kinase